MYLPPVRSKFQKYRRISVGAIVIFQVLVTGDAIASTASSWNIQSDNWDSPDSSSQQSQQSRARSEDFKEKRSRPQLAPFSPGSSNVAIEEGQIFLLGSLGSRYSNSLSTNVHYTYGVSDLFDFESSLGYSNYSSGQFSMWNFLTGFRTNLAWYDKVIPYASAGVGFYKTTYDLGPGSPGVPPGTSSTSISPLLFGIYFGPGVDLEVTRNLFFGGSFTFNNIFGKTETLANNQPFDVGGSYTAFFVHAGVTF